MKCQPFFLYKTISNRVWTCQCFGPPIKSSFPWKDILMGNPYAKSVYAQCLDREYMHIMCSWIYFCVVLFVPESTHLHPA